MADNEATQNPVDALSEAYDVLIQGLKATSDRTHRLSTTLIEDARQSQREGLQFVETWVERPFDLPNLSVSLADTVASSQGRAFEFANRWVGELAESQREFGDGLRRVLTANRSAAMATADVARGWVGRAREGLQSARPSGALGGSPQTTALSTERPSDRETPFAI